MRLPREFTGSGTIALSIYLLLLVGIVLFLLVGTLTGCARYHAETDWRIAKAALLARCARGETCPATIAVSFKEGEVSEFQLMPPLPFLATVSTVFGEAP